MADKQRVTVYSFRVLDTGYESASVAPFKATLEAIRGQHGGDPIEATAQEVAATDLDEAGRYCRLATGWGDLG